MREFINSVPYMFGAFEINDSLTITTCFCDKTFYGYVFNENYKTFDLTKTHSKETIKAAINDSNTINYKILDNNSNVIHVRNIHFIDAFNYYIDDINKNYSLNVENKLMI